MGHYLSLFIGLATGFDPFLIFQATIGVYYHPSGYGLCGANGISSTALACYPLAIPFPRAHGEITIPIPRYRP